LKVALRTINQPTLTVPTNFRPSSLAIIFVLVNICSTSHHAATSMPTSITFSATCKKVWRIGKSNNFLLLGTTVGYPIVLVVALSQAQALVTRNYHPPPFVQTFCLKIYFQIRYIYYWLTKTNVSFEGLDKHYHYCHRLFYQTRCNTSDNVCLNIQTAVILYVLIYAHFSMSSII
jgi:hypothetical protein